MIIDHPHNDLCATHHGLPCDCSAPYFNSLFRFDTHEHDLACASVRNVYECLEDIFKED